jgi:hypothetical protein
MQWETSGFDGGLNERFAVVVDKQLFSFLKDGPILFLGVLGSRSDRRSIPLLRWITIDPDTGALSGPKGVDLTELKVLDLRLHLSATSPKRNESFEFDVCRDFAEKPIKVRLKNPRKDGQTPGHEFLGGLESKMKLASRLKAERELRQAKKDR